MEKGFDDIDEDFKEKGIFELQEVDTAAAVALGHGEKVDPAEAMRIRKKIDTCILPLMCVLYWIQFVDKSTLGSSAILGIRESTHLTTNQYNWLGTIFYLGYLAFQFPQNLCLQRFPVGKWISLNVFVWGAALCAHAACTNFAGLFAVRLILGICEGCITTGFMIVTSMFYTRNEQIVRIGYWDLMGGIAAITSGFISFGVLHIKTERFQPWQWLMIVTGSLTLCISLAFWFLFPDSPTNAWFLTPQERSYAVRRIQDNQTGVENKRFKKEQMIEALTDPKTWLFALSVALGNVPNSLSNQRSIIVSSFGFTNLQTTLLGCVDGVLGIGAILICVNLAARIKDSRAYISVLCTVPNVLCVFLINLLPWENKIGLLFSQWLTNLDVPSFVLVLAWINSVTAGHTKKITVNAIFFSAYCVGNAVSPFMWREQYKPRNHVPWIIIGVCYVSWMAVILSIRYLLAKENKRRDLEPRDKSYDNVHIEKVSKDGSIERIQVDKEFLDLTDIQNRDFRYVL